MLKRKSLRQKKALALLPYKRVMAIGSFLALFLVIGGAVLTVAISEKGMPGTAQQVSPAGLSPSAPSKEYIYAGGRLIATEQPNGPRITGLEPPDIAAGSAGFTLTVNGEGFQTNSVIRFKETDYSITFVSAFQVKANINQSDISSPDSPGVSVLNPGAARSNTATFIVRFTDVPATHLYYTEINKIRARGITSGCTATAFCPNDVVTREQMAVFIDRALGQFNPPTPASQRFNDVPPSNPFYAFIDDIATRGITLGCGGGNFCPTSVVLHEQMAAFIERAIGIFSPPTPPSQRFTDVPPSNPFYAFIDDYAKRQIWNGCGGGNFCPSAQVTRAEMARILVRAFNL